MAPQDDLTAERADLSKIIIAESILDNFEAISSYVIRQSLRDMVEENKQLRAELDRLASEGASAPIDLLPKLNDDGGYGEHF